MNIVLVMSDTKMWKPQFIEGLINSLPTHYKICGAVMTSFGYETYGLAEYFRRYLTLLGIKNFLKISLRNFPLFIVQKYLRLLGRQERLSIAGVCKIYGIPVIRARNINSLETMKWIVDKKPDVLFSSGHQIFSRELLSIPSKCCINRHSSLLPAYRGIYPLFWNLLNDEKQAGVSIHTMEAEIDKGVVVAQRSFPIENHDTLFSLFGKCYALSVELTLEAFAKIDSGDWHPVQNNLKPSYYSFPSLKEARQFRSKGKRIL